MAESAAAHAEPVAEKLRREAHTKAASVLGAELQRLVDLQAVNDHVRPAEIALARERLERTGEAVARSRLRLDSIRLIVVGPTRAR